MRSARLASCVAMTRYWGLMRSLSARCASDSASARDQVLTLELLPGAELPGPEQGDEVVELAQVVLERRRGQQQDEIPLDFLDELVGRAAVALHLVRLVHDDEIPAVSQDFLGVPARARAVVRDDRLGDARPVVGIGRSLEALEELFLELPLPLTHQ